MASSVRGKIIELLDKMGMDNDCDAARIRSHYILYYFYFDRDNTHDRFQRIETLCNRQQIPVPAVIAEKSLDFTVFAQFDDLLSKEKLWASVDYINIVCPQLVADRKRLAKCAPSLEKNAISRIDFSVLYTIGKLDAGISSPEELPEEVVGGAVEGVVAARVGEEVFDGVGGEHECLHPYAVGGGEVV